jgi:SH3-like domain-containing protein
MESRIESSIHRLPFAVNLMLRTPFFAVLALLAGAALAGAPLAVWGQPKPAGSPAANSGAPSAPPSPAGAGQQLCIKAPRANLRAGPGPKFRVTWEVNRYMPLLQVAKDGDWIKVRDVDGDLHWVSDKVTTAQLDCVTVKAERANIRKAPNSKADTWFRVEKYTSFRRVGQTDNWVKIEYEGETMWVAQSLVWPS